MSSKNLKNNNMNNNYSNNTNSNNSSNANYKEMIKNKEIEVLNLKINNIELEISKINLILENNLVPNSNSSSHNKAESYISKLMMKVERLNFSKKNIAERLKLLNIGNSGFITDKGGKNSDLVEEIEFLKIELDKREAIIENIAANLSEIKRLLNLSVNLGLTEFRDFTKVKLFFQQATRKIEFIKSGNRQTKPSSRDVEERFNKEKYDEIINK